MASACFAILAVIAHQRGTIVLPGYPVGRAFDIRYLDWTVPVVAFTVGLIGTLVPGRWRDRILWASSLPLLTWYLVSMQERTTQAIVAGITIVVLSVPRFGGLTFRRLAALVGICVIAIALQQHIVWAPASVRVPISQMMAHWSRTLTDGSLSYRLIEVKSGISRMTARPLLGVGLGIVSNIAPPGSLGPWRYAPSGYGFLLIKTGVIGFGLFVGMILGAIAVAFRRLRVEPEEGAWPRVSAGLIGLSSLLVLNITPPPSTYRKG